jgi:translation initiation factor IF-3
VRLVGPEGEQVGVVRIDIAQRLAQESDLDLVEVSPNSNPPVVKIMDFGKFKYEAAQKAKEARKNQANTVLKEIRFRLKIDTHDYDTKRKRAESFLKQGRQSQSDDPLPRTRTIPPRTGCATVAAIRRRPPRIRSRGIDPHD